MGLIVQNMIAKWEIPSLIKLTAWKNGTVKYLVLIKVEWVMLKVSCLSLEGEDEVERVKEIKMGLWWQNNWNFVEEKQEQG